MAPATAPAAGMGKGKRKRPLSEDDVYLLLHRFVPLPFSTPLVRLWPRVLARRAIHRRYAPATILTALQEVAQHAEGRRIDWKALVGKSATGITSAREYQMLWRHFAYQHELAESVDAGASPLGDDSDLECELEPVPNPSKEALSEASSLAKILISGSSREQASGHRVNLEAPAQNSPNEKIVRIPSDKQLAQSQRVTNVTGPVSNSKQVSQIGPSPDPLDANGASKKKKKIKAWSKEEDADLAAGVQKYGEGNWEVILDKCNFRTRTSEQLSQLLGQYYDALFPHPSYGDPLLTLWLCKIAHAGAQQHSSQHTSTVFGPTMHEMKSIAAPFAAPRQMPVPVPVPMQVPVTMPLPVTVQAQTPLSQGQQAPAQAAPTKASNASNKTRNNSKKQAVPQNPTMVSSSIQAAAIAAGGRIATPIAAANHLKATQSKNAVHIRTRVTASSKSSMSSKGSNMVVETKTQLGGAEHLEPPNTVAPISGPLTTHATQQILDSPEVAAANPPGSSSEEHFTDAKKALSASAVATSCSSGELDDDSTFCIVTMDDLFPEDANQLESADTNEKQPDAVDPKENQQDTVDPKPALGPKAKQSDTVNPKVEGIVDSKDADMLEFDQFVASQGGASMNVDHPDKNNTVKSTPMTQGSAGSQKKQLKLVPAAGISTSICAGASTSGKKSKSPVPHPVTLTPTVSSRVNVSAPATAQNKTIVRKAAASAGQNSLLKKQAPDTKVNQTPNNAAVRVTSIVPANNQASTVVNAAGKANPPGRSQASTAGKANPPGSSQASTLVNGPRKVNLPGKASTLVNGASKANPPGSIQANTVVNIASKANPPGSSQSSKVVKASPPANQ
ncbi:hypothetical protein PR202_gb08743 [Eleusine coracana subsp. coracana]|uniref:Myb-like domain-containing protein n=1 Tax=Eleusine coracana subsp. coracana TaxID=191504 RepID=A0AAV5EDU3_ELECO|nr:hypothetical protein PR202_gb08743 [Eleusine coracana subsp. coracana]